MNSTLSIKKNQFGVRFFLHYLFLHYVFFQLVGILRSAAIYNTSFIANYSNALISLFLIVLFALNLKNIKLNLVEIILLFYPILHLLFGVIVNGISRHTVSDLYTAVFFAILIIFMRNTSFIFSKNLQVKFANWMFWGLLVSILSYKLAPLLGLRIYSVGIISIFSLYPLIVYFYNGNRLKLIITIILILLGGKRGVILSGLLALLFIGVGQKNIKKPIRIFVVLSAVVFIFSLFYMSISPERISKLPSEVQPMFYRMMHTNPFSEYNRIGTDARVLEVKGAMKPIVENPFYFLTGKGSGYAYEYIDANNEFVTLLHNTHFSPVTILSRFGVVYTLALYFFIVKTIFIGLRKMRRNGLGFESKILLLYTIASFINSFTAFTLYIDYLFILSLGLLNNKNIFDNKIILKEQINA